MCGGGGVAQGYPAVSDAVTGAGSMHVCMCCQRCHHNAHLALCCHVVLDLYVVHADALGGHKLVAAHVQLQVSSNRVGMG